MLCHLNLITLFFLIFFNVIIAETVISDDCDIPCDADDNKPVCVFDKDEVCFLNLPSKCVMERIGCIFERKYSIFHDTYCKELENFLCSNMLKSPPAAENEEVL